MIRTLKTAPRGNVGKTNLLVRVRVDRLLHPLHRPLPRGGFVFNTIHNIQANSPIENLQAMFRAIRDSVKL